MIGRARRALLLLQALKSSALARGQIDQSFAAYGRRLGIEMLIRRVRGAGELLITPVSSMRYWELPFAWSAIPAGAQRCLDVSSPRLLSLRASEELGIEILMLNPDAHDAATTEQMARLRGVPVTVAPHRIDELVADNFDCAWSISVIEHIAGEIGDSDAIRRMFDAVRPGGRLIVTIPVDRTFRLEYRDEDPYGLASGPGPYFFQRVYDEPAIQTRIIAAVGVRPSEVRWYGERVAGSWSSYEADWIARGSVATATDPTRMARGYREFGSWADMPGVGVCGLVFDKPR